MIGRPELEHEHHFAIWGLIQLVPLGRSVDQYALVAEMYST